MTLGHELFGNGSERVIALPDWMSTHRSFDDVRKYLTPARFTFAFADNRGYGRSRGIKGEYSAKESARDIVELADALRWDRFHLLGHSMSGLIGQRLSVDSPDRLKSLVLVTPVTAAGVSLDADGSKLFEGSVTDDLLWQSVAQAVTGGRLSARFYEKKLEQHRADVELEALRGFLKMWTTTDFSAEMNGLTTPTLVIAGAHDFPAFSKESYEKSIGCWYTDVRVELLENSGHYPMSETPPYFARVVEDFLEAHA